MKAQVEADDCETVASVQARIKRLKKEHDDVMSKLSAYYAQSVDDDARDQYFQTDDLRYFDDLPRDDEWTEHYARLEVRGLINTFHRRLKHGIIRLSLGVTGWYRTPSSKMSSDEHSTTICRHCYHCTRNGPSSLDRKNRHALSGQHSSHKQ